MSDNLLWYTGNVTNVSRSHGGWLVVFGSAGSFLVLTLFPAFPSSFQCPI